MPNTIQIKQLVRREPTTREDYYIRRMKRLGLLPMKEKRVYNLPKAPGTFSLGPDREPVQVPNDAVVQPTTDIDISELQSMQNGMQGLF